MSYINKCPKCGALGSLRVAYSEHTDYKIDSISDDGEYFDVDEKSADTYYVQLIHVACGKCNAYWYDTNELAEELKKGGELVKPETPARTDMPAGMRGEED